MSALSLHQAPRERFIIGPYVAVRKRTILVPAGSFCGLNLRAFYDGAYGPPGAIDAVHFILTRSTWLRSRSTSLTALRTGPWPSMAVTLTLEVQAGARMQGKGGTGGKGAGPNEFNGFPGGTGGPAFLAEHAILLTGNGEIWAGGGGGGGGGGNNGDSTPPICRGGGGGGGGAGTEGGAGGSGGGSACSQSTNGGTGGTGTAESGGSGGSAGASSGIFAAVGGAGGAPALAGSAGANAGGAAVNGTGGAGGAPGNAIDGVSLVTFDSPNNLDIRGAQVN